MNPFLHLSPLLLAPALLVLAVLSLLFARRMLTQKHKDQLQASFGTKPQARMMDEDVLEDMGSYHRVRRAHEHYPGLLDDGTWQDVDMNQVFSHINHCQSMVGSEVLYDLLRDTGQPTEKLLEREGRLAFFTQDQQARVSCQMALRKAGKLPFHGAAQHLYDPQLVQPDHPALYYALAALPLLLVLAIPFFPWALVALLPVLAINTLVYFKSDLRYHAQTAAIRHLGSVLGAGQRLAALDINQLDELLVPLKCHCKKLKSLSRWLPYFQMERKADPMFGFLVDFYRMFLLIDMVSLCRISRQLVGRMDAMRSLYRLVGLLDAEIAIASWRRQTPHCLPNFHQDLCLQASGLVHPLVVDCVPNDFVWEQNTLITGSNASGKSTFIKALAISAILAQTIHSALATAFALCPSRVMSAMAVRDNLLAGESYYIAEIKALRRILRAVQEDQLPVLCLVDEILRGTNTVERIAASTAVLRSLLGQRVLAINATHDIELVALLENQFANAHFQEEVRAEGMVFPYKIMEGPATGRNAIRLLAQMGFDQAVIAQAEHLAQAFDHSGRWPELND